MKQKRMILILTILLMSIGFAAISTTLVINGNAKVSENQEDFSVIFTAASLDGKNVYSSVVDDTKKIINFSTSELKKLNQTSILTYEVTNRSSQYDAEVRVTCVPKTGTTAKYTSIKNKLENDATKVLAKSSVNGTLTITLNQVATEAVTEEYTCKLEFNAAGRTEVGKYTKINKGSYILVKDTENASYDAEVGDTITVGSENFYVISNDNHKVAALAYYNLNVGDYAVEGTKGIQNEQAKGNYDGGTTQYPGAVAFADVSGWDYKNATKIDLMDYEGPIKTALYDETSGYQKYVQNLGLNATVRLISRPELEQLGCSSENHECLSSKYSWIYSTTYWTCSPDPIQSSVIWFVAYDGGFGRYAYFKNTDYGVRPVIEFTE